jgi:hypothetical protein
MRGLKWLEDLKDRHDVERKRLYNNAIADGSNRRASTHPMTATLELPSTARSELSTPAGEFFEVQVLYTSDFRHLVAFHITSESVNSVVDCLRADIAKDVRHVKARREQRTFVLQYPEVRWSDAMSKLFVVWSDGDGMVHRKLRTPWAVGRKPEDPDEQSECIASAEQWLHDFYLKNHKGPDDLIIPNEVCEEVARDGATGDGDGDGDGAEADSASPRNSDDENRAG